MCAGQEHELAPRCSTCWRRGRGSEHRSEAACKLAVLLTYCQGAEPADARLKSCAVASRMAAMDFKSNLS